MQRDGYGRFVCPSLLPLEPDIKWSSELEPGHQPSPTVLSLQHVLSFFFYLFLHQVSSLCHVLLSISSLTSHFGGHTVFFSPPLVQNVWNLRLLQLLEGKGLYRFSIIRVELGSLAGTVLSVQGVCNGCDGLRHAVATWLHYSADR